jgi:hypothetical protein
MQEYFNNQGYGRGLAIANQPSSKREKPLSLSAAIGK